MSIKEKFESHPVVWGLTLLAVGFTAGFGARGYLLPETRSTASIGNCKVVGVEKLEAAHHARLEALQGKLVQLESSAADRWVIRSDQDRYKEAADRVRQDITSENTGYQAAIQHLRKVCE